ncbi:MAG: DUF6364 family protein [Saprospiraceae bacterium]|nr:DUF6364 family protein [Saprospiraceae bacterium]
MATKLTLTIDKKIIQKAKKYAKREGRSLSNLIEDYLKSITESRKDKSDFEYSPIVKSLWGSVKIDDAKIDDKKLMEDELIKKYLS